MLLRVRIIANGKQTRVIGKEDGIYKIKVAAPPIEGRANEALIKFLAKTLSIAPSLISITQGANNKFKTLEIPLTINKVESALAAQITGSI